MIRIGRILPAVSCAGLLLGSLPRPAVSELRVRFTKIADTHTAGPGGTGTFSLFHAPSFDGANAAFRASPEGIYVGDGTSLVRVADRSTPIPGGSGAFTRFTDPVIDAGAVAFRGLGERDLGGVYATVGGALSVVADAGTTIPGSSFQFGSLVGASIEGETVAFSGARFPFGSPFGIYTVADGSITTVVDHGTSLPPPVGLPDRVFLFRESLRGQLAFVAVSFNQGVAIVVASQGALTSLVDTTDTRPEAPETRFIGFSGASFDGETAAFRARAASGFEGIYTAGGGPIAFIAGFDTPVPDGNGTFRRLSDPSVSRGRVAFLGEASDGKQGIYTDLTGVLEKVIAAGDPLDARRIAGFNLVEFSLSHEVSFRGNRIAFRVIFDDFSQAVYVATLNVPAEIDIKPGSASNRINPASRGVIRVAILGSDDFDVSEVDASTLAFGPAGATALPRREGYPQDVDEDGFPDLVSYYRTQDTGVAVGDTEACVTGETLGGMPFEGCDRIRTARPAASPEKAARNSRP